MQRIRRRKMVSTLLVYLSSIALPAESVAQRSLVVLIDASGSMNTATAPGIRFETAKEKAVLRISEENDQTRIKVVTYNSNGWVDHSGTANWLTPTDAQIKINRDLNASPTGSTPLAGSMCDVISMLSALSTSGDRQIVLYSDGGENATTDPPCAGPWNTDPINLMNGSWQKLVLDYAETNNVHVDPNYHVSNVDNLKGLGAKQAQEMQSAEVSNGMTDATFFSILATETGGQFAIIRDDDPLFSCQGDMHRAIEVPRSIPDNSSTGITSRLVVPYRVTVASLALSLSVAHTYRGDVRVTLYSPTGSAYVVANRSGGSADNVSIIDQTLANFNGTQAYGVWRLVAQDLSAGDVGRIISWSLRITPTCPP